MTSEEKIELPNGNLVTKEELTHYLAREFGKLDQYDERFYRSFGDPSSNHRKFYPGANINQFIPPLEPNDAALALDIFYGGYHGSIEEYQKTMDTLRQYVDGNQYLQIVLDLFDERVRLLEGVAKRAPPQILKRFNLDYLLQESPE